jgi:SAM-dependent methyltransferase
MVWQHRHMSVPDAAARGFGAVADAYQRCRPSYPAEAVAWLADGCAINAGSIVCDLGAGTGKLTRLLEPFAGTIVATEPLVPMLAVCRRDRPETPAVAAVAEAMPFGRATFDAVTVAQAFHWFDVDHAFGELYRVLRPHGRIGVLWNDWDTSVEWTAHLRDLVARCGPSEHWVRGHLHEHWLHDTLALDDRFGPVQRACFPHTHPASPEEVVERVATAAHIAAKPDSERAAILDEALRILDDHRGTHGRARLEFPYRTHAYWCARS